MSLQNLAAERAVLSGFCQYGLDAYIDVECIVDISCFTDKTNQHLFRCIQHLLKDGSEVDVSSILSSASSLGCYELVSGDEEIEYLDALFNFQIELSNVETNAKAIKKLSIAKHIQKVVKGIHTNLSNISGEESFTQIINIAESPIMELDSLLSDSDSNNPVLLGSGVEEYVEHVMESPSDIVGIPSGFPRFDAYIGGGLRRGCIDFVAARAKMGKSMLTDNIALHVANMDIPVLVVDTEMGEGDHFCRILSNMSGVPSKEIANGKFSYDQSKTEKVFQAKEDFKQIPYHYIGVAGKSFEEILSIIRRWVEKTVGLDDEGVRNDCLVIYDYLKLMSGSDLGANSPEWLVLGNQIMQLHALCVKQDFACLSFGQLNRDGITREDAGVVSGSDRIVWNCSSFTIFKDKSADEVAEDGPNGGNRKLLPIVSRHGPGMENGNYINMSLSGHIGRVQELSTRDELIQSKNIGTQGFQVELPSEDSEEEGGFSLS